MKNNLTLYYSDKLKEYVELFMKIRDQYLDANGQIKASYSLPNEEYVSLLGRVIDALEEYIGYFGNNIDNFEKLYGTSPSNYIILKKSQNGKTNNNKKSSINLGIKKRIMKNSWRARAKREEYYSMYGAYDFIDMLEGILRDIYQQADKNSLVISNALEHLTSKKCGIASIDNENIVLLKKYQDNIEKDKEIFADSCDEIVEKRYINPLRNTAFYKEKRRVSDSQPIGNKDSMLFSKLFEALHYLAIKKKKIVDIKDDAAIIDNPKNMTSFLGKIADLGKMIARIESNYKSNLREKIKYSYTIDEELQLQELSEDILEHIHEIKDVYDKLQEYVDKRLADLKYIDALNDRIMAINTTIKTLESEKNKDSYNEGNVNVFRSTINMLFKEKSRCEELLKRHTKLIESLKAQLSDADVLKETLDNISPKYDSIITSAKNRKEKEDKVKREKEKNVEERLRILNEAERKQFISKIKDEVIQNMTMEGYQPRAYNFRDERYDEDYTEFNEIVKKRLAMALREKGIEYSESDLTSPFGNSEENKEKKTLEKQESETMKKEEKFCISEKYYSFLFDMVKNEYENNGEEYIYEDILDGVKKYIDNRYGLENIDNMDEFEEIIKAHKEAVSNQGKRR